MFRVRFSGLTVSALVLAALSTPVQATPFSSALVAVYDPVSTGAGNCGSGPFDCYKSSNVGGATSTQSLSHSRPGFSVSTYAEANLSTAQLKTKVSANVTNPGFSPYVQSNATFSDGFTTTNFGSGTPFVWGGTTATFNLNFGTSNILDSMGSDSAVGFLILGINTKGSTDADSNWFTGPNTKQYFVYEFGPNGPSNPIYYGYGGTGTQLTTTEYFDTVPTSISATFAPGGDFDWVLLFGTSGQQFGAGSFNYDFSHTLTLDYVGPAGTTTVSDSGVFGLTPPTAVPEPMTLALFGAGAAGLFAKRRRQRAA